MTTVAGTGLIRDWVCRTTSSYIPTGVLSVWATSGPAERSDDLHPPQGARGSAARFCLPTVDILCALWKNTAPDGFSSSEHG